MIELNENKLIPGVDVAWGDIRGDISNQSDLMSMMSDYLTASSLKTINNQSIVGSGNIEIEASVPDYYATKAWVSDQGYLTSVPSGYATESWVSSQGYLTSETLPSDLATQSWVSSQNFATESWVSSQSYLVSDDLSQYATRQWVTGRGYITSDALSGYATESWVSSQQFATQSWVSSQGYLTSETLPSDIATQSWVVSQSYLTSSSLKTVNNQSLVGEGNIEIGGLTPEQEAAIEPLVETSEGVLYTRTLNKYVSDLLPVSFDVSNADYSGFLYNIDGDIYFMQNSYLYKFNPDNFNFDNLGYFTGSKDPYPLWKDKTGRMYNGVSKVLDLTNHSITSVDLECSDYYCVYGYNRDSLWVGENAVYNIGVETVSKFDETLQKFVSFNVTVPAGHIYGDIGHYMAMYGLWYDSHFIWFNDSYMYEMTEYDDHIDISVVTTPYFPTTINGSQIECGYVHYIAGDLYYLKEYNYYELVNGSWTVISDFVPYSFSFTYSLGHGVIYGDYLMIGYESNFTAGYTTLLNMSDTVKQTYWTKTEQIAVDLSSGQTITGSKNFTGFVNLSQVNVNQVNTSTGNTSLNLGNNTTSANKMLFTVPGEFSLNGNNIATTDDCIVNRTILPYGGRVVNVITSGSQSPYQYSNFVTHTGRMFYTGDGDYEFDGTQWNSVSPILGGNSVYGSYVVIAGTKTFYVNGATYLWDDTNSVFTEIVNTAPTSGWYIWPCGDGVLRAQGDYKLIENNGTWSWESDTVPDYKYGMTYYINGHVYVLCISDSHVYEYVESTKTYTDLGYFHNWTDNSFMCGGDIIFPYNGDSFYKIDLTKVGGSDPYIDVLTEIPYTEYTYFHGEYDNKLYFYKNYGELSYCYGVSESVPAVPSSNGTYVLKAVRTSSGITYSWVAEV